MFTANAAMLDRPFPFESVPVTLAAVNVMFSSVTADVTPLSTSGIVPAAGATFTKLGDDAVYAHVPPAHVKPPYTVSPGVLAPKLTCDVYVPPHTYTRPSPLACAAAYPIVAYGAASVPAPVVSLPAVDTNTPNAFDTTHGSVGGALSEWHAPSHTKYPVLHAMPHVPVAHVALPFAGAVHTAQPPPQCAGSSGLTHAPPQFSYPVLHAIPHPASAHVALPFAGTAHAVQLPQCSGSVVSFTHVPPQFV